MVLRQLAVLIAGLLVLTGCSVFRSPPSTETHIVTFEVETVDASTVDIKADYSMVPLADKKSTQYGSSWDVELTFHYPDVYRLVLFGEPRQRTYRYLRPTVDDPEVRCRIKIDGVLVAEYTGKSALCVHTMTEGRQKRLTTA
ncbi:hypothetical protein [Cryptosporangium phraense]|uniref:Lipoprotein n=1 Tax=Cryptosporangium phraense TaxID=2593070 RepID=A0A545APA8_9ACTN|nr:hypothetical protein [Cryptosporangium phraense]TQS43164.1 hypothetical protein FL583_20150 [Cryptosporangium phraense]